MQTLRDRKGTFSLLILSFGAPLVCLLTFWALSIRPFYYPSGDEFALLVASGRMFHPSKVAWFLDGFRYYFVAYPGLPHLSTDFIRPVANLVYYGNSLLFSSHWAWYLLFNYVVQSGLVFVSVKLAIDALRLPRSYAFVVGVLVLLSPAFGSQALYFPSFLFDLLAALFVLLALHELWRKRYGVAWVLLALAVFTKETAFFAPVCVALYVGWDSHRQTGVLKRVGYSLLWLLPLLAWALLRHVAFHGSARTYVLQGLTFHDQVLNAVHGLLAWPFGTRTTGQPPSYRLLFFPLNAFFWLFAFYTFARYLRSRRQVVAGILTAPFAQSNRPLPAVLLFCCGAAAMPVLLNLPQRFGAAFYPLLALLLTGLLHSATSRPVRWGVMVIITFSIAMPVYQKTIDPTTLVEQRAEWVLARGYIQAIHASRAQNLLIVNDASGGFTSPNMIARFAGFPGNLWRSNNINALSIAHCNAQPRTEWLEEDGELRIISSLAPSCGLYAFDGVPLEIIKGTRNGLVPESNSQVGLRVSPPPLVALPPSGLPSLYGTMIVEVAGPSNQRQTLLPDLHALSYHSILEHSNSK